jgi:L-serine/L-threonine ammonia-lyase
MGSYEANEPPKPWRRTPLIESSTLSRAAGCRIFLKLENLQPSGSFKSRGIGNFIRSAILEAGPGQKLHFYISSGGNAGLAAVAAARTLGYECTVVLPTSTEESMFARLRTWGASDVVVHGDSWQFADQHLREIVMEQARQKGVQAVYVPPFDNPRVWAGAQTMIEEMQEQVPDGEAPHAVVCSVGGGGLFSGIMQGVQKAGWSSSTQVIAAETKGAESLNYSLEKGELSTLSAITSLATSLGAIRVAPRAFELAQSDNVKSIVLTDAEACMGCWRFADDERILVEPACGVSIALAYQPSKLRELVKNFGPDSRVVLIVCGGARIDLDTIAKYRERFGPEIEHQGLGTKQDLPSSYTSS